MFFFYFFIFTAGVSDASEPRRRRVWAASEPCRSRAGAVSENREKKKKRDTAGHRNPARRTRSGVRHVSDTDTTPKMACPCNLVDTFNGMSWIRRRHFDKTSSASSKLPENDIGSNKVINFLLQSIEQFQEKRTIKRIGKI